MTLRRLRGAWPLALVILLAPAALARPAGAQESCTTSGCHDRLVAGSDVHPAAEDCSSCHESVAEPHPQKGVRTFQLAAQPPELCTNCHDAFGSKAQVHEPVAAGECTTCHDPHSSSQAKLLTAPVGELCGTCHSDVGDAVHPHGPVAAGECTTCHTPHESDAKPLLAKAGEALCFDCHGEMREVMAKSDVHPAAADGCTTCHAPHGASQPKLLAEPSPALCFQCHDDVAEKVTSAAVVHPVASEPDGCANCHSPHATDQASLLLVSEKETCLGCHADVIRPTMTVLHQPVGAGRCTSCHDPHGAPNGHLLHKPFPSGHYAPYSQATYGLCFECHNPDLARYPDTSFATNFRDGERNLHYVHVNDPRKGRSCALCHDVHGGTNDRLIADSVEFGTWKLPIQFRRTETGGSCAPGCHQPLAYDRERPVGPSEK